MDDSGITVEIGLSGLYPQAVRCIMCDDRGYLADEKCVYCDGATLFLEWRKVKAARRKR